MAEADSEVETPKDKDNPFSFKKFLKRSSTDQNVRGGERKTSKSSKTKTSKKTRDEEETLPFPELSEDGEKGKIVHVIISNYSPIKPLPRLFNS